MSRVNLHILVSNFKVRLRHYMASNLVELLFAIMDHMHQKRLSPINVAQPQFKARNEAILQPLGQHPIRKDFTGNMQSCCRKTKHTDPYVTSQNATLGGP
jgi:hypothetical protein